MAAVWFHPVMRRRMTLRPLDWNRWNVQAWGAALRNGAIKFEETEAAVATGDEPFCSEGHVCNQGETELAKKNDGCHEQLAAP